jgi:hypothetical protein
MKNTKLLISLILMHGLFGCSPSDVEQKLLLEKVKDSVLISIDNPQNPNFTVLKIRSIRITESFTGWVSGDWVACAEIKSQKPYDEKAINRRFIFTSDVFNPLILEDGKFPNLEKGNQILWRDLCSF